MPVIKTRQRVIALTTVLIAVLLLEAFVFLNFGLENESAVTLLSWQLLIWYVYSLIVVVKRYGYVSVSFIFLCTLGLFNLSRILLNVFGYGLKFYDVQGVVDATIPVDIQIKLICVYMLFLAIFQCFALMPRVRPKAEVIRIPTNINYVKLGQIIMLCMLPFVTYRYYSELILIARHGYTSLYVGILNDNTYNIVTRLAPYVFSVGYYCLVAGIPRKKVFNMYSFLYFCVLLLNSLKGSRGGTILFFIYLIWYYRRIYGVKIPFRRIATFAIPIVLLLQVFAFERVGKIANGNIITLFLNFFYFQGESVLVPAFYMEYIKQLSNNPYPYILDPVIYVFNVIKHPEIARIGQTKQLLQLRWDLGHHLTYFLNPGYYLKGMSIGNNFHE